VEIRVSKYRKNANIFPMKKAAAALLLLTLAPMLHAGEKWNDVLSTPAATLNDPVSIHTDLIPGAQPTSTASPSELSTGRQIIIAHLNSIKSGGLMVNTISLEPYWQGVFAAAGHPELYASSEKDIQVALEAGLSPYLRGETITSEQFADAAIAALQKGADGPVAAASSPH
jgi:hypothetical protein